MEHPRSRHYALCICVAAALLAACGGLRPPIGAPRAIPQSRVSITHAAQRDDDGSWMAADAASQDLLYISNVRTVTVYSYPQGKLVGTLRRFYSAQGECVDQRGDVFITNLGTNQIFEYAHGSKKRLRTLTGYGGPAGCSVDPTTGNLAVSNLAVGSVAIYENARGKPKLYKDPAFKGYFWCGYDPTGNLFVDGESSGSTFEFAELPKGGSSLKTITLNQNIGFPGGVQWDGKYMAVGDQDISVIYQFVINGSEGTKVGTTSLGSGLHDLKQFWIQSRTLIAPNGSASPFGDVLFYNYPAGGNATKKITAGVHGPIGAVVSLASQ